MGAWKPPLPGPLLHKCVEEREKTRGAVQGRKARYHDRRVPPWPMNPLGASSPQTSLLHKFVEEMEETPEASLHEPAVG